VESRGAQRWEEDTAASLLIMEVGTGTIAGPPYGL
jgi:hypothetical protein